MMEFIEKDIPLWKVTIWDKKFSNVDKSWQTQTIKYHYLLSDELDSLKRKDGNVRILYTGKDEGYTTEDLAGSNISDGEVVTIPWGGTPTVKYHKGKFVTGDNRIVTSVDKNKLSNKYLYYYMRGNLHIISTFYRGASLKHPCMKDVLKMLISYPHIEYQDKICNELDTIELLITKQKEELELLDELVKARFVELFGDPVYNEKQWKVEQFGSLGELKRGKSKHRPRNDPILLGGKYPLIQTGDISNSHTYIQTYKSTYSEEGLKQSKMWKAGTLCITIAANIAESAILTFDACFPDSIVGFLPNDKVNLIFIHHWLDFLQPILEENAPAVAQKNLNVATLEKVGVILPPLELQNQFAAFVKEVDKSRFIIKSMIKEGLL